MDETRNCRKERAVELGRRFEDLGVTQDHVAHKIHLSKGYVCRIFNEYETQFVPSEQTLGRLEQLVVAEAEAMLQHVFEMGLMTVEIVDTCNAPGAHVGQISKELLARLLISALASIVAGKSEPMCLPVGIDGILARIGAEQHSMHVIAVRSTNVRSDKRTLAHEYEDLARYFKSKANELRGDSEPPEPPSKWF